MYKINWPVYIMDNVTPHGTWTTSQRFNSVEEAELFADSWNLSYYSIEEV